MTAPRDPRTTRRAFLGGVGVSMATLAGLTAGQSFGWLAPFNLFAPRRQGGGPQQLPITRTAKQAHVADYARDPSWTLAVGHGSRSRRFSRKELLAHPQTEVVLPIACVEGWSTYATWRGVRLRDLVATVGGPGDAGIRVTSLEPRGHYRVMTMGAEYVQDPATLVALEVNGETLDLDHGYPARMIAPGRPGVLQTKWLRSIEVLE